MKNNDKIHCFLLLAFVITLIWSGINPKDYFTWFLEVFPAIIGVVVLMIIYNKFKFTTFVYVMIFIHTIILMVGGHYTYAEMPVFNWIREIFNLDRNYYDRLGHFAQGFIPALVAREILIKKSIVKPGVMLSFIIVCICVAISATYEIIEFIVAITTGTAAEAFLGTQGDVWDTQWDMLFALIGALTSVIALSKFHDNIMNRKFHFISGEVNKISKGE